MNCFIFNTTAINILLLITGSNCMFVNVDKVTPTREVLNQQEIEDADSLYKKEIMRYHAELTENQESCRRSDINPA